MERALHGLSCDVFVCDSVLVESTEMEIKQHSSLCIRPDLLKGRRSQTSPLPPTCNRFCEAHAFVRPSTGLAFWLVSWLAS